MENSITRDEKWHHYMQYNKSLNSVLIKFAKILVFHYMDDIFLSYPFNQYLNEYLTKLKEQNLSIALDKIQKYILKKILGYIITQQQILHSPLYLGHPNQYNFAYLKKIEGHVN